MYIERRWLGTGLSIVVLAVLYVGWSQLWDRAFVQRAVGEQRSASKRIVPKGANAGGDFVAAAGTTNPWPQWRGPQRDGISPEKGLLDSWPAQGPPLAWKTSGLGGGFSSVAVTQGKIFTMGQFGGSDKLIALDAKNGSQLWATNAGTPEGAPNSTPTVDRDLVFGVTFGGDLLCAESATGKEVWKKSFRRDFGGTMMSGWGYSESVLVDGDRVICTPGSQQAMLAALDRRTGRVLWTTKMLSRSGSKGSDGAAYSSIVISHAAGTKQYVQLVGRGVIGVDASNGELLWGYNDIANGTANIPTPIVRDDFVFCSTGYGEGGTALLRLTKERGRINPQVVYYLPASKTQNHHGGAILLGKHIYMGHGHSNGFPLCLEFLTGKDVWRPGRGPGSGSAAVAYADGHLYFRYENGVMALIEATPDRYRVKGQFQIAIKNGESWPHPAIADGKLYLRDQDELACYDIRKH